MGLSFAYSEYVEFALLHLLLLICCCDMVFVVLVGRRAGKQASEQDTQSEKGIHMMCFGEQSAGQSNSHREFLS